MPTKPDRAKPPALSRRKQAALDRASAHRGDLMFRSAAALVVVAAVLGTVLLVARGGAATPGRGSAGGAAGATSTDPAGWKLPRIEGAGGVALADFRGKPTVVNFFASWCDSCRFELPGFAKVSTELSGKVTFVGVNSLETGDGLAMARQFHIDGWRLARDVDGQQASGLHDALGGQGMPLTAFYDRSGKLLTVQLGALTEDALRAKLHDLYGVTA